MPTQRRAGKPTTRRYTDVGKGQAVRVMRQLRVELGTDHGTVKRVAEQLGFGVESVRSWVASVRHRRRRRAGRDER